MTYRYPSGRILVFAKAPIPKQCKTRMQPFLNPEESAELQRILTKHTLQTVCNSKLAPVELYCSPDTQHPFHTDCHTTFNLSLTPQIGNTLGERMHHAACRSLDTSEFLVIIGVDCPTIDAHYLDKALKALHDKIECAIGPAADGGYVLIGLRRPQADLFKDINWGSNQVLQQTIKQIKTLGLSWKKMHAHSDLDTPDDLNNFLYNSTHPLRTTLFEPLNLKPTR